MPVLVLVCVLGVGGEAVGHRDAVSDALQGVYPPAPLVGDRLVVEDSQIVRADLFRLLRTKFMSGTKYKNTGLDRRIGDKGSITTLVLMPSHVWPPSTLSEGLVECFEAIYPVDRTQRPTWNSFSRVSFASSLP